MRIGLDFGTTTSLISDFQGTLPTIVPIGHATTWMPSIIGRVGDVWAVGDETSPLPERQLIRSIKRAITERKTAMPIHDGGDTIDVDVDTAMEHLLAGVSRAASREFVSLTDANVVRMGCPAMWAGDQRARLLRIAEDAGIGVGESTLIDEPIAAGVAWINDRLRRGADVIGQVLVIDMGGGTLDVAVLDVEARVGSSLPPLISVLAAEGRNEAGDAVDELIATELAMSGDFGDPEQERPWLLRAARELKADLATRETAIVAVSLSDGSTRQAQFTRDQLSEVFAPQGSRMIDLITHCLRAARMTTTARGLSGGGLRPHQARAISLDELAESVDFVLIAGGMARSHLIPEVLGRWFPDGKCYAPPEPDHLIALGLAHADTFERMNLHRPGFDFALEWEQGDATVSEVIYEAYQPLYRFHQVLQNDSVRHTWRPARPLPTRGQARLIARTPTSRRIRFRLDGTLRESLPFGFGYGREPLVSIEPSGRIFVRDGRGMEFEFRISEWPVIFGEQQQVVTLTRSERTSGLMDTLTWHQLPSG